MKSKYDDVRRWLLNAERYEDVEKFDSSADAKEYFIDERKNSSICVISEIDDTFYNKTKTDLRDISDIDDPAMLRQYIQELQATITRKDYCINNLKSFIKAIISRHT